MALTCYRHKGSEATTTCGHCRRPICPQCFVYRDGAIFCSEECGIAAKARGDLLKDQLLNVRTGPGLIATLFRYAVLGAIGLGILEWLNVTHFIDWI